MIGLLAVVGAVCAFLAFACWWADSRPPEPTERVEQSTHVRVVAGDDR